MNVLGDERLGDECRTIENHDDDEDEEDKYNGTEGAHVLTAASKFGGAKLANLTPINGP